MSNMAGLVLSMQNMLVFDLVLACAQNPSMCWHSDMETNFGWMSFVCFSEELQWLVVKKYPPTLILIFASGSMVFWEENVVLTKCLTTEDLS